MISYYGASIDLESWECLILEIFIKFDILSDIFLNFWKSGNREIAGKLLSVLTSFSNIHEILNILHLHSSLHICNTFQLFTFLQVIQNFHLIHTIETLISIDIEIELHEILSHSSLGLSNSYRSWRCKYIK